MPAAQEGLSFLFEIQDKITAKLAKIEAKSKASAAKIDKAFTKASKSQETNSARAIAAEQRRIAVVEKAHARAIAGLKRESDAFKRSMTRMASAATVAFAVVAGKALDMAGGYDAAMRSVQAKTQASGAVLEKLSDQAREMGRTTVHSATAAARGQAFLAAAGFDAQQILVALPPVLALATAGELDLASAADIASNVLSGFQMETKEMARVVDVLALAAASSNTSVAQMGAAMAKAAPAAKAAGWSLEATAASIGKLSDAGIQGEEAGTVLNTMMARLGNASGSAEAKLRELGIEVKDATTGAMLPLNDILTALAPHADDVGLQFELLGTRGAKAGFILGAVAQDARELTGELKDAGGTAQKMADIMGGGLWGTLKAIGSVIDDAYISLGESLAPALQVGLDLFRKLPGPIKTTTIIIGSLAGAMGGLMLIAPQAFGAIVQLPGKLIVLATKLKLVAAAQWLWNAALTANPIGLVVTAVALLASGLYLLSKRQESVQKAFDASAVSTEDLTSRYDDLTEKVTAATERVERLRKTSRRNILVAAKSLRALVAERDELKLHIQQRAKLAAAEKKAADKKAAAAKKVVAAEKKVKDAVEKSTKAVKSLMDSWTGATLQSKEFLRAFRRLTPEQKENNRIMDQVLTKYESMRKVLGPLDDELEKLRRATQRWTPALGATHKEQENTVRSVAELTKGLPALNIEVQNTSMAQGVLDLELQAVNESLSKGMTAFAESKMGASGYELALASLSGQMGGATGQALNLVIAMREHNKTQKAAALAGKKTEAQFGKMRVGAGYVATAFSAIGDAIGGTAGAVLSELGNIASAFATGGIVGGIMAGIGALIKGLASLFSRGKKKRAAAAKAAREAAKEAAEAAAEMAASMAAIRLELLSLPTLDVTEDFALLRKVWERMPGTERVQAMENYAASLQAAADAGLVLSAGELRLLNAFVARNEAMDEATARQKAEMSALAASQKAEMAGIDMQIDAIESRLRPRISELQALIDLQEAELSSLSARQDAEMAGLAARRQAALDLITASQAEQLSILQETQRKELDALKAARAAALGVVESAIQRELEDERIAAQLKIDLRKAGGDQEAIDAAHARAATSTERLLERDELDDLMAEAEARVRARYQDELATINDHWDDVEAVTTERFRTQQTGIEVAHALELAEHDAYWNELEALMALFHSVELAEMEAAHTAQLEALLASLVERRDVLVSAHATELLDLQSSHAAKLAEIESYWSAARRAELDGRAAEDQAAADRAAAARARIEPDYDDDPWGDPYGNSGFSYRQHGGPVNAGGRFMVGEAGPEMFVPSERGRIEPHGSSSGGASAKDLARAVAEALEGMAVNVDGRKLGRLTVRHQPLAVAELGGRR